jgi:N-acyl homoserine lactone hydrolase
LSDQRPVTVTPIHIADLHVEGEVMSVNVHLIDHPEGRVLVDTGMTELHPLLDDMAPLLYPLSGRDDFDVASVDMVVNTHLHGDHIGGSPGDRPRPEPARGWHDA